MTRRSCGGGCGRGRRRRPRRGRRGCSRRRRRGRRRRSTGRAGAERSLLSGGLPRRRIAVTGAGSAHPSGWSSGAAGSRVVQGGAHGAWRAFRAAVGDDSPAVPQKRRSERWRRYGGGGRTATSVPARGRRPPEKEEGAARRRRPGWGPTASGAIYRRLRLLLLPGFRRHAPHGRDAARQGVSKRSAAPPPATAQCCSS